MSQMKTVDRDRIEFLVSLGWSLPKIAADLGRSPSTIRSELLGHRLDSDKGYGCSNRLCAHFDECLRRTFSAHGEVLRKNSRGCFESCPDFREATCHRLARPPFVCNGCEYERGCPLKKKFYVATAAQAGYETTLRLSRTGIHPSDDDIGRMNAVLSPSVRKGQSVSAVMSAHGDVFKGFGRSTVYGWIEAGLFSAKGHDLPYAGRSRKPKPKPVTKTNAKCRIGRTIREMWEWLKAHPDVVPCELDTVIGSVSGKVLFTMIFPKSGLALGFLRDQKTSQTCTRIFNMLAQESVSLTFSHLNSYPRETRDGKTPYDLFVSELGDEGRRFLDALEIRRIPAAQVTLHPFLLGQKFQRAADKATLRKNGVTGQKKTGPEK